jgi:hypothetical protein
MAAEDHSKDVESFMQTLRSRYHDRQDRFPARGGAEWHLLQAFTFPKGRRPITIDQETGALIYCVPGIIPRRLYLEAEELKALRMKVNDVVCVENYEHAIQKYCIASIDKRLSACRTARREDELRNMRLSSDYSSRTPAWK